MIPPVKLRRWLAASTLLCALAASSALGHTLDLHSPDGWRVERRGTAEFSRKGALLDGKVAVWEAQEYGDFELRCRARIVEGVEDGAIWLRFRHRSDNEHYALALRGAPRNDLYLFRFSPGGQDRLLALEPLDFAPQPGRWYDLRVCCVGPEIEVFLSNEPDSRLYVADDEAIATGRVGLGGGYRAAEYSSLTVEPLASAAFDHRGLSEQALKIDFRPSGLPPVGWQATQGESYSPERGFGWDRDMSSLARMRGVVADALLDTVISVAHEVHEATFTIDRPDGEYTLLVCGGDPAFPTHFEFQVAGEATLTESVDLAHGAARVVARPVTVQGGKLGLTFRSAYPHGTRGGSVAWVALDPQSANPDLYAAASESWDRRSRRMAAAAKREHKTEAARRRARSASRSRFRPVALPKAAPGRQVLPLDGTWLFLPDQDREEGQDPRDRRSGDAKWHGLEVPQFWTPIRWWIYGPGEGISDTWVEREQARVGALSFDADATHAGWYRHWITIPKSYQAKRLALHFGAVAMTCQVWLNGGHIGGHTGMFAPFDLELPHDAIRWNQQNLITVFVADGAYEGEGDPSTLVGTEVTVEITREMLNGLPRGMYGRSAGIWQPASLVATEPVYLRDVFARTTVDGLEAAVELGGDPREGLKGRATVTDPQTGGPLTTVEAELASADQPTTLAATGLTPQLWSADHPNLYRLRVDLVAADGALLDSRECDIGFRTFEVRGNRLFLNGRPYWLRGANHAPSGLAPNSPQVATDFLRRMHQGNTVVLRAHGSSFTETWLQAADREGVGVSMEGLWPWVMIDQTPPPSDELLDIWEAEWTGFMRSVRNHPSILMWTLNNESYWHRARDPELRKRKWAIATRMMQAMRAVDPTRPIVCDSGYVRNLTSFNQELQPNGFDDGDIDDAHMYYGWYAPGPWRLYPQAPGEAPPLEQRFSGTRPAITQEFSTGYPNNDTGHPTRKYIDQHYVAQAWVGDYAYEDRDPAVFLQRHAWMAKELTELARRHADKLCGLLHFSNSSWFRFPYDPALIEPYPAYAAMQTAMAPVLVSADLRQRRFYPGDTLHFDVHIVNDSAHGAGLPAADVRADLLTADGAPLAQAAAQVAPVPYYGRRVVSLTLPVPEPLPTPERADYRLALKLSAAGAELARNEYPLVGAAREWARPAALVQMLREPLTAGEGGTLIANGPPGVEALRARPELQAFVQGGGCVLVMNGGEAVKGLLPDIIADAVDWQPEIVTFEDEASPLLDGLEPLDACWFNGPGGASVAATGGYRLVDDPSVTVIAAAVRPHGYLQRPTDVAQHSAAVIFEARIGTGRVIVSELNAAACESDPVAARLIANLVRYACGNGG